MHLRYYIESNGQDFKRADPLNFRFKDFLYPGRITKGSLPPEYHSSFNQCNQHQGDYEQQGEFLILPITFSESNIDRNIIFDFFEKCLIPSSNLSKVKNQIDFNKIIQLLFIWPLWHFELQKTLLFLQEQFLSHLPKQLHFNIPCPPQIECRLLISLFHIKFAK
ncbi:hypothetical protein BpHYR1_028576 [Brachionus plicatilis]|uniref:Uncharacterized protein n=1 Tax=Brachionus plicatilis TaxID=10195 RepID=A0A3M7QSU4_BRAPC|nr:hypothetical protein BpHYR1_028576 [Brachionus plicatilis]